jgi:hypothetical protein
MQLVPVANPCQTIVPRIVPPLGEIDRRIVFANEPIVLADF